MSDFRVKVSIRNANLLRALGSIDSNPHKFAKDNGFCVTKMSKIAAMTMKPTNSQGDWWPEIMELCKQTNIMPSELFSEKQLGKIIKNSAERDVGEQSLFDASGASYGLIDAENPEVKVIRTELLETVMSKIDELPKRYARIFKARRIDKRTLQDIGDEEGVSKDRIRQIEHKAHRDIVHKMHCTPGWK